MIKQIKYLLFVVICLCFTLSTAEATIKLDASRSVGEILKSVSEQVSNTVDSVQKQLEHLKTYQKMFDGIKEGMNKIDEIKSEINDVKSAVNDAKSAATDAVNTVSDAKNSATGLVADATATATNMANAQELVNLQTDLAKLQTVYEGQIKEIQDARDAEAKKYEDDNKTLEKLKEEHPAEATVYQLKIVENQTKIDEIDKKYKEQIDDLTNALDNDKSMLKVKIDAVKEKALSIMGNVDDPLSLMNSGGISDMFSGKASSAMNEVIANNFYKKDEEDSVEGNKRLMAYRRGKFLDDAAEVYYQAVQQMSEDDKNVELTDSLQSNAQAVETTPAAIMLDIPIKIENMKRLLKFARLLTAEMKMATSKDMINMPKKLNNYDKDVTAFNIDDYAYSDSKKGLLKKLESLKQQAAELKANEAASKVGSTTTETVKATNIVSTTKSKFAGIFRAIKTILYIISGFGLVGIAFQAIRGRLSWGWFAGLAAGLAILAAAGAFIEYATGDNNVGEYFGDTATNAAGY